MIDRPDVVPPLVDAPSIFAAGVDEHSITPIWGIGSAVLVLGTWILTQVPVGIALFAVAYSDVSDWTAASLLLLLMLLTYVPSAAVILVVLRRRRRSLVDGLGFRAVAWFKAAWFALIGSTVVRLVVALVTGVIIVLFRGGESPPGMDVTELFPPGVLGMLGVVIAACIAAPLFEEMMFRGVLMDALSNRWGLTTGMLVSSLVFAVAHLNLWMTPGFFIIGLWLAFVKVRTKSLWGPIVTHAAYNFVSVVVAYALAASDTPF